MSRFPAPRTAGPQVSWGKIAAVVYLPTALFEIGIGAINAVLALDAHGLGASIAISSVIVSLLGVGQIVGDIPAGSLATKIGDRKAMLFGAFASTLVLVVCALASTWKVLLVTIFLLGAINAIFMLARQAYLTEIAPPHLRARAFSTMGGVQRIGMLVGPFIGAWVIDKFGLHGIYWLAVVMAIASAIVVLVIPDPELPPPPPPASDVVASGAQSGDEAGQAKSSATTWGLVRNNLGLLASLGVGVLLVGAIRAIRFAAVPLWSEHIGLSASMTSAVVGLSGLFDIALFYPAGKVMDVKGRMWVAVPSMALLGAGIMLLPVAHTLGALIAIAALIGIGNGIGAGIIMTTGADAAPVDGRAKFLSVWRFMSDFGGAAGPLIISLGTALGSLVGGIVGAGVTGLLASAVLAAALPRWSVHATNRTRRAHGVPVPQWRRKRG